MSKIHDTTILVNVNLIRVLKKNKNNQKLKFKILNSI